MEPILSAQIKNVQLYHAFMLSFHYFLQWKTYFRAFMHSTRRNGGKTYFRDGLLRGYELGGYDRRIRLLLRERSMMRLNDVDSPS